MSNDTQSRQPQPRAPQSAPAPTVAADDPRARAAKRATELREHLGSMDENVDKFFIDPRLIPDGWSYEWKVLEVLGKPNPAYQVQTAQRGWEAVPRTRHPEMMPDSDRGETITRDGMILMERPKEITDEVKQADFRRAREQVRGKEAQLAGAPAGTFERDNKGNPMASVKKSYETIKIPD